MTLLLAYAIAMLALTVQQVQEAPADAPSTARLTQAGEPGQPLTVSGTVVSAAGEPIPGASLYVYQTDAEGYYGVKPASDSRNPRLKAFLRSAPDGSWSFETIRPGSYPGSRVPGHVHFEVAARGFTSRVFEIVFEGDPFITEAMRSNPAFSVRPIESGRVAERIVLRYHVAKPRPRSAIIGGRDDHGLAEHRASWLIIWARSSEAFGES